MGNEHYKSSGSKTECQMNRGDITHFTINAEYKSKLKED
jgi:hypothetical protein